MGKIILKTGVKREKGYLYFITKEGNLVKTLMKRPGSKLKIKKGKKNWIIVKKLDITKKKGRLYYVDGNCNIGETTLVIERNKRKK